MSIIHARIAEKGNKRRSGRPGIVSMLEISSNGGPGLDPSTKLVIDILDRGKLHSVPLASAVRREPIGRSHELLWCDHDRARDPACREWRRRTQGRGGVLLHRLTCDGTF